MYDKPVGFNTNLYLNKRKAKLEDIDEQLEKLRNINKSSYPEEVKKLENKLNQTKQDILDEEYDKYELQMFPIKMTDYNFFFTFSRVLMYEKNVPNIYGDDVESYCKAIGMSYLMWLIEYAQNGALPSAMSEVLAIMSLSFQIEIKSFVYYVKNQLPYIEVNEKYIFDSDDFDSFRKILVYQTLDEKVIDFKNEAQLEKERVDEFKSRGTISPNIEQQVVAFCASKRCKKSDVFEMSIREFMLESKMIRAIEEYDLTKIGIMSGAVSFKNPNDGLEHYLFRNARNGMEGFVSADEMTAKIKG